MDMLFKLARKALTPKVYRAISASPLGRQAEWAGMGMPKGIWHYYRNQGIGFRNKTVLEVGGGGKIFTALFFLAAGARRVVLVDPRLKFDEVEWLNCERLFRISEGCDWEPYHALSKIECYPDLAAVPANFDSGIDVMCSHFVLEHFHDLESFFVQNQRLLAPTGISHHRVDLTDHTYHVLTKYPLLKRLAAKRSLYHLRYPDWMFNWLNDSKCHMNRKLLPDYLRLAKFHNLAMECVEKRMFPGTRVNPDLIKRCNPGGPDDLDVADFSMNLAPR